MEKILEKIAKDHGFDTLKTRNHDDSDFYDTAVWTIKEMMEEAYKAGQASKKRKK